MLNLVIDKSGNGQLPFIRRRIVNMIIASWVVFILPLLIHSGLGLRDVYPNCAQDVTINTHASTTSFNKNFLALTGWVYDHSYSDNNNAFLHYISTGSNQSLNQKQSNQLIVNMVTGSLCVLVLFGLILCRFEWVKRQKKKPDPKSVRMENKGVSWVIYTLCICFIVVNVLVMNIITPFWKDISQTSCQSQMFIEMLKNGNPSFDWEGIQVHTQKLRNAINLIQLVKNRDQSAYNYSALEMPRQIVKINNTWRQIQNSLKQASFNLSLNSTHTTLVKLKQLLPNISSNDNYLSRLSSHIASLSKFSRAAASLEGSLSQFMQSLNSHSSILSKSLTFVQMQKNQIGLIESQKQLFLDQFSGVLEICARVIQFLVAIACIVGFSLMISVLFLQMKYQRVIYKIMSVCWVGTLVVFILNLSACILLQRLLWFNEESCSAYKSLLYNQTSFQQTFLNVTNHLPDQYSLSATIRSCLFSNHNYLQLSHSAISIGGFVNVFGNFTSFLLMNQLGNANFVNLTHHLSLIQSFQQDLFKEEYCLENSTICNYAGTINLLSSLNANSLSNVAGQNCFKDMWVIDRSFCPENVSIVSDSKWNSFDNSTPYSQKRITCLSFNMYNDLFQIQRTINQTQFISIYHDTISNCPTSYHNIVQSGLQIIQQLEARQRVLSSIREKVDTLKSQISIFNTYIRNFYYAKKKQYDKVFYQYSLRSTSKIDRDLNYFGRGNNCSAIKYHLKTGYATYCLNLKASLRKVTICLLSTLLLNSAIIFVSFVYSNRMKALYSISELEEEIIQTEGDEKSSFSSDNLIKYRDSRVNKEEESQLDIKYEPEDERLEFRQPRGPKRVQNNIVERVGGDDLLFIQRVESEDFNGSELMEMQDNQIVANGEPGSNKRFMNVRRQDVE